MTLHIKNSGSWSKVNNLYIKQTGVWTPVKTAFVKSAGVWTPYYNSEITVELSGPQSSVILQNLFTSTEWSSATPKRVIILSDAVLSGPLQNSLQVQNSWGAAATWGGNLIVENRGIIQGMGGVLSNGGNALDTNNSVFYGKQVTLINSGTIRSGGGAGGKGGAGTGTTDTGEQFSEYPITTWWAYDTGYSPPLLGITINNANYVNVRQSTNPTSYLSGNNTFYRGAFKRNTGTIALYGVRMVSTVATTGGNGGRGQGSDGAAASGAAGGVNAGTGGTGGNWGENGVVGFSGNAGAGSAGYLAGVAYTTQNWSVTNTGTILGRVL